MKNIYLDNASCTEMDRQVRSEINRFYDIFGNPSSMHFLGRQAKEVMDKLRNRVAKVIGCKVNEIIFTGSGTESDNLAILGVAESYQKYGKHIIVSKIEHKAVLESVKKLKTKGFKITYIDVNSKGIVNLNQLKKSLRNDTILVSVMYANNEIGIIEPISKISKIIFNFKKDRNIPLFHTDACQAVGLVNVSVKELGVDLLTCSGSKIYGPKGIGCLYKNSKTSLEHQILGGGQEGDLRSGTENIPLISGFAKAMEIAEKNRKKENKRLQNLKRYFVKQIKKKIPKIRINSDLKNGLPNNINMSIFGVEGEAMVLMLDKFGIYCSTGSACASLDLVPSHVLLAIGLSPELAHGSIRLSMGRKTIKKDLDYVLKVLPEVIKKLRKISSIKS